MATRRHCARAALCHSKDLALEGTLANLPDASPRVEQEMLQGNGPFGCTLVETVHLKSIGELGKQKEGRHPLLGVHVCESSLCLNPSSMRIHKDPVGGRVGERVKRYLEDANSSPALTCLTSALRLIEFPFHMFHFPNFPLLPLCSPPTTPSSPLTFLMYLCATLHCFRDRCRIPKMSEIFILL